MNTPHRSDRTTERTISASNFAERQFLGGAVHTDKEDVDARQGGQPIIEQLVGYDGVAAFAACITAPVAPVQALGAAAILVASSLSFVVWCGLLVWRPRRVCIGAEGLRLDGPVGGRFWAWPELANFRLSMREGVVFDVTANGRSRLRGIGSGWPDGDAAMVERLSAAASQYRDPRARASPDLAAD